MSRDPLEERGGINLMSINGNDFINFVDILGLKRPCMEEFKRNYLPYKANSENGKKSTHDVYDEAGGDLNGDHDKEIELGIPVNQREWHDSCALRLSLALNACGGENRIPSDKGYPNRGGRNPKEFKSAKSMCAYLKEAWGAPDYRKLGTSSEQSLKSEAACSCFAIVWCNNKHVGYFDAENGFDSEPIGQVVGWKLPCCGN